MIEVRLLGPPRVLRDGELVAFDTRKAMALLAHLALTDRPRPRDALAELLWPGADVDRGRGALRRTLSSLRGAVGAGRVEATRDHVRLLPSADLSIDVVDFRLRRAAGDHEGAVAAFRGDLLEGFAVRDAPDFEEWVEAEAEALRRELTASLADLASAREAAGDLVGAVAVVQRWLDLDPLHEPAHQALIRMHATTGDRAAALVQYRECVRTLSHELGVPPLAETTELYEAVNRGSFAPPLPERAEPPAAQPPAPLLVGRERQLSQLLDAYAGIGADGRVVVVEGEAGIGKTRLVEELHTRLRPTGAVVLHCRGYEEETALAYGPLVELLRDRMRADPDWARTVDDRVAAEAGRLVPELAADRPAAELVPDGPGAEARFLAALWELLAAAAAGAVPGVLVLDDAQWADDATLRLVSYGVRRLAGRPLLVVLCRRTPHDHAALRAAVATARSGGGAVVQLGRLDEQSVGDLLRGSRPDPVEPAAVRRLWLTTEGVPLLLVEHLRAVDGADEEPLPTGAREVLRSRLDPVSETGRQVLAAAAVLGRHFDVETVRSVSGRTDEETVTALEEAVRRGLVREREADYDFDHELVRTLVYEETSLARRRLLHGRAAEVVRSPRAAMARHLHLAGRDAQAADAYREAGELARAVFANAEALSHLRTALALGHPERTAVLRAIGEVQTVLGDYPAALASLHTAAAGCSPEELSGVEHQLGRLQHRRGEYALAEAHLEAALAAARPADTAARASITADLSLVAQALDAPQRAGSLARDALTLAERADDPRSRCQAHNLLGMLAVSDGDPDEALAQLRRSSELADWLGDEDLRVAALNNLALAHRSRGELERAEELTATALELCSALGDRHREAALHNNLADVLHASGRGDDAMTHLKTAVEIFADIGTEAGVDDDEHRPEIWKLVRW